MSESPPPTDASSGAATTRIVIAIVRTGGIAGIRRRWRVEADPDEAPQWIALIERCPWEQTTDASPGADRFVWSIRVHMPEERRETELPDTALQGPWRELVDAVRKAQAPPTSGR